MYAFITILIVVVCFLLGLVVLIQNPKGGGLNASFGGVGQQLLGARNSTDVVEKFTWGCAAALIILCISTSFFVKKEGTTKKEMPKSEIEQVQGGSSSQFKGGSSIPTTAPPAAQPQGQPANTGK